MAIIVCLCLTDFYCYITIGYLLLHQRYGEAAAACLLNL